MDAHRSRSLGMAALVFILISLTAAVFHGAAPVRAEDVTTPTPIVINGDTADVTVGLYADKGRRSLSVKRAHPRLRQPILSTVLWKLVFMRIVGLHLKGLRRFIPFPTRLL